MPDLAVYIHVPFCLRKCAYCDFNAYSGADSTQVESFVAALLEEIRRSDQKGRHVTTIFFGGGTPTFLDGPQLTGILQEIRSTFNVAEDAEISAEANPSTIDAERFEQMYDAGFNRLSIGAQAFDDRLLRNLDRTHSAAEARDTVSLARNAGFRNLSLDLMFGLPGQSLSDWEASVKTAIDLNVPHISVYALTLEPGTRFERLHAGGKLVLPDEDDEVHMYERAITLLTEAGFEHYEVSNFCRPGFRCRHNLVYWRNEEYAGFGPGAVSYNQGRRWTNERNPALYARKIAARGDLAVDSERLSADSALGETLIQGLRLREGVDIQRVRCRYGIDPRTRFEPQIAALKDRGLMEEDAGRLRLTHSGLLLANDVSLEFLP